jgi:hypothetical protein
MDALDNGYGVAINIRAKLFEYSLANLGAGGRQSDLVKDVISAFNHCGRKRIVDA